MTWKDFYNSRINNPVYESYFKEQYRDFLHELKAYSKGRAYVVEVGCGTGLVSKLLRQKDLFITDCSKEMLELTEHNFISKVNRKVYSILERPSFRGEVVHSHGVLEHFNPMQLKQIRRNLTQAGEVNIHYVPTAGYARKSFGNENLWSVEAWLDIIKPDRYIISNEGKDLTLIWKSNSSKGDYRV